MSSSELLDQTTCPHTNTWWDETDWECSDCYAYCDHADSGSTDFECSPAHLAAGRAA